MPIDINIGVVVPTHNRVGELLDCLESIYQQEDIKLSVFVINDGSKDNTTVKVKEVYPDVSVIEGDGNLWWSGSNNLGIKAAINQGCNYILLLNDDNILAPNAVKAMLECALTHADTIVGSLVLIKNTNTIGYAGAGIDWLKGGPFLKDYRKEYTNQYQELIDCDFLGGQGVLIESSIFTRFGLFDAKSFPQYHGDADFYIRVRKQGIKIVVTPDSIVWDGINPDGFPRYGFRQGLGKLIEAYTSRRSAVNLVEISHFFYRHCPIWLLPFALTRKLIGFSRGYLRAQSNQSA
jgi:GT2 family glycosyltransferase